MTLSDIATLIGITGGILVIGGGLIAVLFFALKRKWNQEEDRREDNLLKLTEQERDLYKRMADRVPELEQKMAILREEVGAAAAIRELRQSTEAGFTKMVAALEHHQKSAARADAWQAAYNRGTVDGLNRILAVQHLEPIRVDPPAESR